MTSNIKTVCCVPGAHFDLGWCGTPEACLCRGDRIILSAIQAITGDYPDYRFTVEYAVFMDHFLCSYPEYSSVVKGLAHEGRLEVACSWSGMINQILPGEAIIRDITRAKQWILSVLELESRLVQFTDIPGHTQQLPQILTKLGIDFMIYSRYHPPTLVHKFRAPNGDEVLACNHPNHYDWAVFSLRRGHEYFSRHFRDEVERIRHLWPDETLLMGDEGDLKGPDPGIIETIQMWNREDSEMQIDITTASEFMRRLRVDDLPVYQGEMPYGFATIPAFEEETYRWATKGVNQLISGEKFSVFREILGLGRFDWNEFERGWRAISYPHDHNIGGKHGEVNDRVRTHKAIEAYEVGDAAVQGACATIAENVRLMAEGLPLVVFNPLSWIRTDVVEAYAEFQGRDIKSVIVKDHTGCIMPSQVESIDVFPLPENDTGDYTSSTRVYFVFEARNVPSIGYKTFYVYPDYDEDGLHYSFKHDTALIENSMYRIAFNSAGINSVYWKAGDKEIVRKCGQGFAQLMIVEDIAEDINQLLTGAEWYSSLDFDNLEVVELGAVRSTVRIPGKVANTHFSMDVALYENLDYFDVSVALLWNGERNRQVRMVLPFNVEGAHTLYGCPFGSVSYLKGEMEGTYRGSGVRFIQNWVDLSNSEYGLTMGADHGCFDLGSEVATIYPVLLRTAFSCGDHHLWYENRGERTFRFRFKPHSSDWRVSLSQRIGDSLNIPMYNALVPMPVVAYYKEPQEGFDTLTASGLGELGETGSLVSLDCDNVVVSAIVKDELKGWNMRLYETDGQSTEVTIEFAQKLQSVEKVDFLGKIEENLKFVDKSVVVRVSAYEICQIHFELGDHDD